MTQTVAPQAQTRDTGQILDDAAMHQRMFDLVLQKARSDDELRKAALKVKPPKGQKAPTPDQLNREKGWVSGGHLTSLNSWSAKPTWPMATKNFHLLCEMYSTYFPDGPDANEARQITGRGGSGSNGTAKQPSPEALKLLGLGGQQGPRRR